MSEPSGPVWLDVTPLLGRLTDALQPGQLIHSEHFSLFDAMTAIEIGNPRMDPGCVPRHQGPPLEEAAPLKLPNALILKVMDQLIAQEVSWYTSGNMLAQTVFTCLYLLYPERLEHLGPLRAYCKAVKATCIVVRELVQAGSVAKVAAAATCLRVAVPVGNSTAASAGAVMKLVGRLPSGSVRTSMRIHNAAQEEDFQMHTAGIKLEGPPREGAAPMVGSLTAAEERLAHAERLASSSQASTASPEEQAPCWAGLRCRLRFRRLLIQVLYKLRTCTQSDLEQAHKLLLSAQEELAQMQLTQADEDLREAYTVGFDLEANHGQLGPAPPRVIVPVPLGEAWRHMKGLLAHLLLVCHIPKVDSWQALQAFLQDFAMSRPGPVARSAMYYALSRSRPAGSAWGSWGLDSPGMCQAVGLAPSAVDRLPEEVHHFLDQALVVAREYCQAMCLNHARVGRSLRARAGSWGNLHAYACSADSALYQCRADQLLLSKGWEWQAQAGAQGMLATWVERETCALQAQVLLLGFETQVYAPPDFCMIYWYCDYLLGNINLNCQQLLHGFPRPRGRGQVPSRAKGAKKASNKGKGSSHKLDQAAASYERLSTSTITVGEMAHALRFLCQGFAYLFLGLGQVGLLPGHPSVFNTLQQRFEQRFAFCHRLSAPIPLPYDKFLDVLQSAEGQELQVFSAAQRAFLAARQTLDSLESTQEQEDHLKQLAMKNQLAAGVLLNTSKAASNGAPTVTFKVSCDFSLHPSFPVVGLKSA